MVDKGSKEVSNCHERIGNTHFQLSGLAQYFSEALRIRKGLQCDEWQPQRPSYALTWTEKSYM